jgi:hypothetical protein
MALTVVDHPFVPERVLTRRDERAFILLCLGDAGDHLYRARSG